MKNLLLSTINPLIRTFRSEDIISESDLYWNKSREVEQIKDYSHWRGIGRWKTDDKWSNIGITHYYFFEDLCKIANIDKEAQKTMVEWGPGGGSNAVKFAENFSLIFGVDISEPNLQECTKQLQDRNFKNFFPILIRTKNPEYCKDKIHHAVDFFLSTAVFQHFPSKSYGVKILELAHLLLKEDGIALIQIRYDNGRKIYMPKQSNYEKNVITFTSYKLDEFWNVCKEVGLRPLYIHLDPSINYAYFFLKK